RIANRGIADERGEPPSQQRSVGLKRAFQMDGIIQGVDRSQSFTPRQEGVEAQERGAEREEAGRTKVHPRFGVEMRSIRSHSGSNEVVAAKRARAIPEAPVRIPGSSSQYLVPSSLAPRAENPPTPRPGCRIASVRSNQNRAARPSISSPVAWYSLLKTCPSPAAP